MRVSVSVSVSVRVGSNHTWVYGDLVQCIVSGHSFRGGGGADARRPAVTVCTARCWGPRNLFFCLAGDPHTRWTFAGPVSHPLPRTLPQACPTGHGRTRWGRAGCLSVPCGPWGAAAAGTAGPLDSDKQPTHTHTGAQWSGGEGGWFRRRPRGHLSCQNSLFAKTMDSRTKCCPFQWHPNERNITPGPKKSRPNAKKKSTNKKTSSTQSTENSATEQFSSAFGRKVSAAFIAEISSGPLGERP